MGGSGKASRFGFCACILALALLLMSGAGCGGGNSSNGGGGGGGGGGGPVTVGIDPANALLVQGQVKAFTAAVSGTTNTAVSWSVREGAAGGSITGTGVYTAPNTLGTYHIIATSQADPSKSATAAVSVAQGGSATGTVQ